MGDYVLDSGRGPVAEAAARWWLFLLMGIAAVVIGFILVLDLVVAVETLALLVAIGLIVTGLGELFEADRYRTVLSVAAGVVLVVTGILAVAWPDITLWALAVVTAIGLLMSGAVRVAAAMTDKPDGWRWLLAGGILSLVAGVFALAWPGATVLVLAILLGVRLILFGAVEIGFALMLRDAKKAIASS